MTKRVLLEVPSLDTIRVIIEDEADIELGKAVCRSPLNGTLTHLFTYKGEEARNIGNALQVLLSNLNIAFVVASEFEYKELHNNEK